MKTNTKVPHVASRKTEHGEYQVLDYFYDGRRNPDGDYFTNDKADAEATAADMLRRHLEGAEMTKPATVRNPMTGLPMSWAQAEAMLKHFEKTETTSKRSAAVATALRGNMKFERQWQTLQSGE